MTGKLTRKFHRFHYVGGNRIAAGGGSSSRAQEMTMLMLSLVRALAVLVQSSVGKSLCPIRLWRRLRALVR
jgi:hypothetical protein